ncbi:MAG TPA: TetR family transcriptional regulator [Chitinophagaceae bacterium]|nr:TetR family transcriptional regulator [Chitinophagaceae bacterium]
MKGRKEKAPAKAVAPLADINTEEKIKNAAREVFHKNGFAATRTRDIATAAGINLALLNYYFRSKQKLFDIIMLETLQGFVRSLLEVFNEEQSSFEKKLEIFAERHIELMRQHPGVPIFILSEIRSSPESLIQKMGVVDLILKTAFVRQLRQGIKEGRFAPVEPLHVVMNLLGMTAFPFVAKPLLKEMGRMTDKEYDQLMLERKKMVPRWLIASLKAK